MGEQYSAVRLGPAGPWLRCRALRWLLAERSAGPGAVPRGGPGPPEARPLFPRPWCPVRAGLAVLLGPGAWARGSCVGLGEAAVVSGLRLVPGVPGFVGGPCADFVAVLSSRSCRGLLSRSLGERAR